MQLTKELSQNYTAILREELVAAMGCTEPIAIAYAAAKARRELGAEPEHIRITCSGNMIKNVKGVTVPNSGGQKGIETAAVLGVVGGNADKMLEVIADVDDAALLAHYMSMSMKEFLDGEGFVESDVEKTIKNMGYIGKIGMKETDREILNVMIDKVDVDSCL